MRTSKILWSAFCALVASLLISATFVSASAQQQTSSVAFSNIGFVPGLELTGTAVWTYGSDHQTGAVKLKAFATGESRVELNLSGQTRIETQNSFAESPRACTWSGSDGVAHNVADHNCWLATVWFLPQMTLQPGAGAPDAAASLTATADGKSRLHQERHLQNVRSKKTAALLTVLSASDLEIDPDTHYPVSLQFNSHPDNDANTNLPTEIRFSDYRNTGGLAIPFHIQKFVNQSLVLDLQITAATVVNQ